MIVHLKYPKIPRYIKPFRKGYDSLRVEDAPVVSKLLSNLLGQSAGSVSMKMNGTRGITDYEEQTVCEIFKSFGINAFTGEILKPTNDGQNYPNNHDQGPPDIGWKNHRT